MSAKPLNFDKRRSVHTAAMEEKYRWEKVLNGDPRIDAYKWEFLRRNEEFKRQYAALAKDFPEWISEAGTLISPAPSFYPERLSAAIQSLTDRWGIMDPIHPSLSSTAQLPPGDDPPSFEKPHEVESGAAWAVTQPSIFSHRDSFTAEELRHLVFEIDIAQPFELICAELDFYIELARQTYESQVGPLPAFRKRRRTRFEEYDSYLKVWDLRMEQGLTFEQIAFRLFPREMKKEDIRDAVTKRVRSQFQRAKKLIQGEYRQIGT